jgi:hypothetical protein
MKDKQPNFTPEQEARIRDEAPLNQAKSRALAAEFGKTERSVTAKAVRMGVAYERKQSVTKNGQPVERKEAIVSEISEIVGANLEGLDKAPKGALQAVRNFLRG